jgi:predicted nucleic acid-binding protein
MRVAVSDEVVRLAGDIADRGALRGYDAMHLATALLTGLGEDVIMLTWDRPQARAALGSGLSVAPATSRR